jgi:cytidyltransferase-like protein
MVFGTFDGLHDGHRSFFEQARKHGDRLIAVVAPDKIAERLKGKRVRKSLEERMAALVAEGLADVVVSGDVELGTYEVVRHHQPHVIALGYDQKALHEDLIGFLEERPDEFTIVTLEPHEPGRYHSSIL